MIPGDYLRAEVVLALLLAFGPVVALVLAARSMGRLRTSAWLVTWGAVIVGAEHASFAITNANAIASVPGVGVHARYHFYMAGAYTLVAALLIVVIAHTLLVEGRAMGWYALLGALTIGGGLELVGAGRIVRHGLPPSWPLGLALYGYFAAWLGALIVSRRAVFTTPAPSAPRVQKGS